MAREFLSATWRRITDINAFLGQVTMTMMTNLVIAALGLATGLLAARILGPHGRGELAAIQSWPLLFATLSMLGMPEAVVYFSSRFTEIAGRYLASALVLILPIGFVFALVGWWLMPWLLAAQSPVVIASARMFFIVMVIAYALVGIPHQLLRAVGAWRAWNIFRVLPLLGWMLALLSVLAMTGWATPVNLSWMYAGVHLLLIIPVSKLVRRHIERPYAIQKDTFRPLLGYGVPAMLNVVPQAMNLRLDQLLMATFLEPRSLGLYVVAVAWGGAAAPILNAVGPVLFPRLSAIQNDSKKGQFLIRVVRLTGLAVIGLTGLLMAITPLILPLLFGDDYRPSIPAAIILLVANGFNSINLTLANGLRGMGRPRSVLMAEVAGLVVTAMMLWLLLPLYGILGAAIASLLAYATVCACQTIFIIHSTSKQVENIMSPNK